MSKGWWIGWVCLCMVGCLSDAVAASKKPKKAFVVTRSVEGRNSAHTVKRARQRVLVAARTRCGKQGLRNAGVWRQRCRAEKGRVICTVKRRFVCGRQGVVRKILVHRKKPLRGGLVVQNKRKPARVRRSVSLAHKRRVQKLAHKRRVQKQQKALNKGRIRKVRIARRESKAVRKPMRRMSLRGGICTRAKALRGVGRSRKKEAAQKQARQAARRHAARQCKGRQVVWMAAWRYRCSKRGKGQVACIVQNNARCCGGRMTARLASPRKRNPLSSFAP